MTERKERDYSQGLIYKLCCNNLEVKEIYVGSTINFKQRKYCHKSRSSNEKFNVKLYQFIRNNGGWDNWNMVLVEYYNARDIRDLESRERYWLETLKATLNCNIPVQNMKEYSKKYREKNKEIIKKNKEDNKKQSSERDNKKFNCECGGKYTRKSKARHERLQKHIIFLSKKNNITEEKCVEEANLTELVM
jgi:group I intron endonuclease